MPQKVVGVVEVVSSFAEHRAAIGLANDLGGVLHILRRGDGEAGQNLCLGNVGGENGGQGEQKALQRVHGLLGDEPGAAGGHHDRVYHDVFRLVGPKLLPDDLNERGGGDHADLDCIGENIRKDAVQLLGEKIGGGL